MSRFSFLILASSVIAILMAFVTFVMVESHADFRQRCEAAGGKVDRAQRGFFCVRDGVYIHVDNVR